jgi:hypothetical protein
MMGVFLIAAAVVAQNDDMTAEAVTQGGGDTTVEAVAQDDDVIAEEVAQDDAAIAAKVRALQKHVVLGSVRIKAVVANRKTNAKTQTAKIVTEQDQDDPFVGTIRFTVEMADGTNIWCGQEQLVQEKWTGTTAGGEETGKIDYTGEDVWYFKVPFGKGMEMRRADVKAYAVEYGFVVSNKVAGRKVVSNQFVVVAAKYKQVTSADEIMVRNQGTPNVLKIRSTGRALKEGEGEDKESGDDANDE